MRTVADSSGRQAGHHCLLITRTTDECRRGATAWVERQLHRGAKVYYRGWPAPGCGSERHWLFGPDGSPAARSASMSGQLEFLDFAGVVTACDGTTDGLRSLLFSDVQRAMGEGWPRVAMSQESTRRAMADTDEVAAFRGQEDLYDEIATRWPVTTLCQLTLAEENPVATWESAAHHHAEILDPQWSSLHIGGRWWLNGTLDVAVVDQFGAALSGALAVARTRGDPDLRIDLAGVTFMDLSIVQTLFRSARSVGRGQRVLVHGCGPEVRRLLDTAGRPRTVIHESGHTL